MPIGNYSHRQLVGIICKLIGKAHGTDGCFEFDRSGLGDIVDLSGDSIFDVNVVGVQTITSGDVRIENSPTLHFAALAIAQGAAVTIEEPYGTLEIA